MANLTLGAVTAPPPLQAEGKYLVDRSGAIFARLDMCDDKLAAIILHRYNVFPELMTALRTAKQMLAHRQDWHAISDVTTMTSLGAVIDNAITKGERK